MSVTGFLTLKGQKQGEIRGSVTLHGRENSILVHSFSHEIVSPRDAASGLPTGKRQHRPVTVLKEVDSSSPLLWRALVSNEVLVAWELRFWQTVTGAAGAGTERQFYTVRLTNATIASIRSFLADNEDLTAANLPLREEIAFTYQKVEWVWTDGNVSASDSWQSTVT